LQDFEPFEAKSFVSRLLGMGDLSGLVNTMKDLGLDDNKELVEKLSRGVFTLRDMREQFENLLKMGPLSQVMSMIPGFGQDMIPKGQEKEGQARIKRFMCVMDRSVKLCVSLDQVTPWNSWLLIFSFLPV
jgi:signal recognition particle subunit SRP54